MKSDLNSGLMARLSECITDQMGLHYPPNRWADLERGLQAVAGQFGCSDATSCAQLLLRSFPLPKKSVEILAVALTIGETYFFREKKSFDLLTENILPQIISSRQGSDRRLRIWSAGCCTGEEPYSIAILLDRFLPCWEDWNVTILGTDMNPLFLQKATEGIYTDWSFRSAPSWLKANYFHQIDKYRFEILPRIKNRVSFRPLNLAEDLYPSLDNNTNAMDLIFCRNVLLYFKTEGIKKVANNFHRCLVEKGCLFVSPTEASSETFSQFNSVQFPDAQFYQKGDRPPEIPFLPMFPLESPTTTDSASPVEIENVPFVEQGGLALNSTDQPAEEAKPNTYEEALASFEQGNYLKASELLRGDLKITESTSDGLTLLARICANLGDLVEAQYWVEKAIKSNKLNAGLHYLRAIILQEQGAIDEGIGALRRALYLDPNFVLAHFALGNTAVQQKKFREADKHFSNVLSLLAPYQSNDVLPLSDGLVAGRLKEMVESAMIMERAL